MPSAYLQWQFHSGERVVARGPLVSNSWGWSGLAKVSYILRHRGIQLILAYSWARKAILVVGKGRGRMFYYTPRKLCLWVGGYTVFTLSVHLSTTLVFS